jgi:beta-lactam-binding protein with PASTA domain
MPSLVGMSYGSAVRFATALGLRVTTVGDAPAPAPAVPDIPGAAPLVVPAPVMGPVVAQSPESGFRASRGDTVRLTLGRAQPVEVTPPAP